MAGFGQAPAGGFSFSTTGFGGATASAAGQNAGGPAAAAGLANLPKAASTPLFSPAPTFGASAASAPAQSSFSFGAAAQPTQAATPSPFGTPAPAAAAPPPSLFGASATTSAAGPQLSFGGWGAPAQQQGQQQGQQQAVALGFAGSSAPMLAPDLSAIRELESIKNSYVAAAGNPRYRFQHLLLNVVDRQEARRKPAEGVDELAWREAMQRAGGPDNPEHLWPVLAHGFTDLLARKAAQDAAIVEHKQRLEALTHLTSQLASRQQTLLREGLEAARRRHVRLCRHLLRVLREVDALEGRFAQVVGYKGATPRDLLRRLSAQLAEIEAGLAPSAANSGGLQGKVAALAAAARLRAGAPAGTAAVAELESMVDPLALDHMYRILQQYGEAVGKVGDVLSRDERQVAMLEVAAGGGDNRG